MRRTLRLPRPVGRPPHSLRPGLHPRRDAALLREQPPLLQRLRDCRLHRDILPRPRVRLHPRRGPLLLLGSGAGRHRAYSPGV